MAKTLRSRIAAVAVVALGAGLLSAAPASAAVGTVEKALWDRVSSTVVVGDTVSNDFSLQTKNALPTGDTLSATVARNGAAIGTVALGTDGTNWVASSTTATTYTADATGLLAKEYTETQSVDFTATAVGTTKVRVTAGGKTADWSITVVAAAGTSGTPYADSMAELIQAQSAVITSDGASLYESILVTQKAGAANYVKIPAVENANFTVDVSGATATPAAFGFYNPKKAGGVITTYTSTKYLTGNCADAATVLSDVDDLFGYTAADCEPTQSAPGYLKVMTPTATTLTVVVSAKLTTLGVVTLVPKQVYTIVVVPDAAAVYAYTDFSTTVGGGRTGSRATSTSTTIYAPKEYDANGAVRINWVQTGSDNNPIVALASKAVTVSLTGVGSLADPTSAVGSVAYRAYDAATSAAASGNITVFSDGRAGSATVAVSVNGAVAKTYTVKFYGKPAKVSVTANATIGRAGGRTTFNTWDDDVAPAFVISVVDADGTLIPGAAASAVVTSSDTSAVLPSGVVPYTGLYAGLGVGYGQRGYNLISSAASASGGKATLTWTVTNWDGTTATGSQAVTLGGSVAKVVLSFDKTTYAQGSKATITATATDSAGNPVYDGAAWGSVTSNLQYGIEDATLWGSLLGGKAVGKLYAPTVAGTWTFSGLDASAAENAISVSATVSSAADLDAVKAQVAALSTTITGIQTAISTLIASTAATLTSLTAKINKIMKKLKIK